jgi:hypothetical protein
MSKAPTRKLPDNIADLEAQRVVKPVFKLIDEVERAYGALYENDEFRKFREALDNDETVEGSIAADDFSAARLIREKGEDMGLKLITQANLTDISIKLRAAERRFHTDRKSRARVAE